jgi:hypothetical protein
MGDCVQGTGLDPQGGSSPKLLERLRAAVRSKHYSRRTEQAYVHWIPRFIVFHHKKHPSTMGASEIGAFLSWLAVQRRVRSKATTGRFGRAKILISLDICSHLSRDRQDVICCEQSTRGLLIVNPRNDSWSNSRISE